MHAGDLLSRRAALTPNREALVELDTGRRYTYGELGVRANRMANFLRERCGVQKGDRVSILAQNSVLYMDLLYGLGAIGAVFAPLNWRLTAHELTYIVNDSEPKVLICGPEFTGVLAEFRPQVHVEHYIAVQGAQIPDALDYETEAARVSEAEPKRPPLHEQDPYTILYTSGTTGRPKGAVLPHRQVLWNCINTVISWGLTEYDISPVLTPLFHAGGLFAFITPLFYVGGKIILAKGFDADESLRVIQREKCTVILGVPTLYQMWMNSPEYDKADFSHVHYFINGGASCPVPLMQAWRNQKGVIFRQGYGLTEVGTNCFSMTDEDSVPKSGSVGRTIFHSAMKLVDPETGNEVETGQQGELLISGPTVCSGYWRNPEATAQAIRDGWFYTGDMAWRDADGYYYIVGRYKDMIKSGGENVYAAEVEAVFREHPAVADAALIGLPDEKWGEVGLIAVLFKPGQSVAEEELLALATSRLARFKIPKRVVIVSSLPYSPYGKIIKAELKKQFV